MKKRALALGGGGARGAYEIGVWRALREMGEDSFSILTGTSVGALNGAVIAQGDYENAVRFWEAVSTKKVLRVELEDDPELSERSFAVLQTFTREILRNRGADTAPLREMLAACIQEDRVRASHASFGLVTVSLPDGKEHCLFLDAIPQGKLLDYLMASSAFFPAMQAQEIDGKTYVDGGYFDNVPIAMAVDRGAEEVIAVDLQAPGLHRGTVKKEVPVLRIACAWDLGPVLLFEHSYITRNMQLGYLDTLRAFGRYEGVLYALQTGTAQDYADACRNRIFSLYQTLRPETALRIGKNMEPLKWRVLRALRTQPWGEKTPLSISWMENAGRIFGVSPLRSYTAREFYTEVKSLYRKQPAILFSELETRARASKHTAGLAQEFLKTTDRRAIASAFYEQISLALHDEAERKCLWGAALLFPAEAAAAVYLACSYESLCLI